MITVEIKNDNGQCVELYEIEEMEAPRPGSESYSVTRMIFDTTPLGTHTMFPPVRFSMRVDYSLRRLARKALEVAGE